MELLVIFQKREKGIIGLDSLPFVGMAGCWRVAGTPTQLWKDKCCRSVQLGGDRAILSLWRHNLSPPQSGLPLPTDGTTERQQPSVRLLRVSEARRCQSQASLQLW